MATAPLASPALTRSVDEIRSEFPILERQVHGRPIAYLDSGATAQKPLAVIDALDRYWTDENANVHRGVHTLSEEATALYEGARATIAGHLRASAREVIFTRNVTGSLNLVAHAWGRANVAEGDHILLTEMEHHSNIVPWYLLAKEVGAHLDWVPVDEDGRLDMEALATALERSPKVIGVAHISNVLGTVNPIADIVRLAHEAGAIVVVDGAQAAPKLPLDLPELGVDFYGFTGHKLYGPTGVGVLYGRRELLEAMGPYEGGGSMIRKVTKERITWADVPARFEAGTPPIAEAIGLAAAVEWLDGVGLDAAHAHETEVGAYALDRLAEIPGLRVFGPPPGDDRVGIVSFVVDGVHAHDVSEILDRHAIAVRAGHHCAQILMDRLGVAATTRASLAVYNTREEIDRLVDALNDVRRIFELD
jgi:cysteine desulfurase/selenocysteine lyase